jgi:hypothetical protein
LYLSIIYFLVFSTFTPRLVGPSPIGTSDGTKHWVLCCKPLPAFGLELRLLGTWGFARASTELVSGGLSGVKAERTSEASTWLSGGQHTETGSVVGSTLGLVIEDRVGFLVEDALGVARGELLGLALGLAGGGRRTSEP